MRRLPTIFALALAMPATLAAQDSVDRAAAQSTPLNAAAQGVAAVLKGERAADTVFSAQFLAAVSPAQLATLKDQIEAQFGPLQGLENVTRETANKGAIALRFARAIYSGPIVIDAEGKVAGLLLNDYRPVDDGLAAIERDLARLPGQVGVLYAPLDGEPVLSVNPDAQFAIGSTFKLYVLSALAHQIERGERRWDEVVRLDPIRSLPSGQMQDWPADAPVTLHTLATLMISNSDNTATDQLIHLLGRAALADEVRASGHSAPERMLPFLTTLELFALKGDEARGEAFAALPEDRQGVALEELAQQLSRDPQSLTLPTYTQPTMIGTLEWFASAADKRRLLARIAALQDPTARAIMAVSPSMPAPRRKDWRYVGYKGGSEPGVLDLTWLLQKPDGSWWTLAMSWNDTAAPVDTSQLELIAQRILALP